MAGPRIAAATHVTKARSQRVPPRFSSIADQQHGLAILSIAAPLVLGAAKMSTVEGNYVVKSKSMV